MSELLLMYVLLADGLVSTTYGYGEYNCGTSVPAPCEYGAITASGEIFNPAAPSAAIFAPTNMRMRPHWIYIRADESHRCVKVRLNDKGHPRFIKQRGFDLSPAAVELLTGKPASSVWSGVVHLCKIGE